MDLQYAAVWAVGSVIRVSQWIVSAVRDAPREWNIRGNAV